MDEQLNFIEFKRGDVVDNFSDFICYELKVTMKKIEKHLSQRLDAYGINFAQSLILLCLLSEDGSTLSEIGGKTKIENSSLTSMADKLEGKGLVARRADAQDRRIIRVFLTEKGQETATEVLAAGKEFNHFLEDKLDGLSKPLLASLKIISKNLPA